MFLRGHGSRVSTHYGVVTHQSGALGAIQGDAIRNITGTLGRPLTQSHNIVATGAFELAQLHTSLAGGTGNTYQRPILSFDASRQVPIAPEIRPANVAVRYLMRALP